MIEIRIPYKENDLAGAYNEAMQQAASDWVLLLDHDVFLATNKNWYKLAEQAIQQVPENTGLITCKMNAVRSDRAQAVDFKEKTSRLKTAVQFAARLETEHGAEVQEVKDKHIAGAFMLVNKRVWQKVRFQNVRRDINFIDWDFCDRLLKNGYKIYVMQGLFVYHGKTVKNETK